MSNNARTQQSDEKKRLGLFWCSTEDHHEDWFVLATDPDDATRFFCDEEGYDRVTYVRVDFIVDLPDELQAHEGITVGWPTNGVLEKCGATITMDGSRRAVFIRDNYYVEGRLQGQIDSDLRRLGFDPYGSDPKTNNQ